MGQVTILVVDDERDLADLYSMWIDDRYEVRTAYGGEQALEMVDESIDIVLLDRRMPDVTGDEVLARIREGECDPRVVMVTAVDPGLDIIEMDFDEYLTKPVSRPELNRIIENMRIQHRRAQPLKEHASVSNKMAALEREIDPESLERTEEYRNLQDRLKHLGNSLTDRLESTAPESAEGDAGVEADGLEDLSESLEDLQMGS
jgi:DNA-binding response OmpR family regulator